MSASSAKARPSPPVSEPTRHLVCRWLPGDEARASQARFVRLVVDERCWAPEGEDGHSLQRNFIRDLTDEFHRVAVPPSAVILMPAGAITTDAEGPLGTSQDALVRLQHTIAQFDLGRLRHEVLLGVDLNHHGTWLQSVMHLDDGRQPSFEDITVKSYPASSERSTLWGWNIAWENEGQLPAELTRGRVISTHAGPVLVLVCHEAVLLSNRSRSRLVDSVAVHLRESIEALLSSGVRFVLLATHYLDTQSGSVFKSVASQLEQEGFVPIVTTFAPSGQLDDVAGRFGITASEVATLLVDAH